MKKLLALFFALVMCLGLMGCQPAVDDYYENPETKPTGAVGDYVRAHQYEIIEAFKNKFTEQNISCWISLTPEANSFTVKTYFNGMDGADAETKASIQQSLEDAESELNEGLYEIQAELPELEFYTMEICEEDGDLLASFVVDG